LPPTPAICVRWIILCLHSRPYRGARRCAHPLACSGVRLLPSVHRVLTLFAALLLFSAQVAICALSGAMETAWVALAQLGLYLYMDRGCSRAACVLWRPLARNGIRHPTTVCVRGVALSHVHVACFGRFSGRGCYGDSQVVQFRPLKSAGVRFFSPGQYHQHPWTL
jgi:hypothetical protein